MDTQFDYIIVGAGSAGCILARRLSDVAANRVLLLEAGPEPKSFWISTPAGMAPMFHHPVYNWNFETEPEPHLNGRRIYWPRGKVLGGSSAINGLVWIRGDRRDYDHWQALGNPGWGWDTVGPLFDAMENDATRTDGRKQDGPVGLTHAAIIHPTIRDFIEAGVALGLRRNEDFNSGDIDGVGLQKFNVWKGRRVSSYDAYVAPIRGRANLTILTGAQATRVLFEGRTATGVEVAQGQGPRTAYTARREVILAAGALQSPHLLMLSGIGNPEELRRHQIEVRHALPGVGENLQDHFAARIQHEVTPGSSYNAALRGWRKYAAGAHYLLTRRGYLALGSSPGAAMVKSHPDMDYADIEISFRPMTFSFFKEGGIKVNDFDAMSASIYRVRPSSRGRVRLRSADPFALAVCEANYLSTQDDIAAMISGMRTYRAIVQQEPLARRVIKELMPGPARQDDESLLDYMRSEGQCTYHLAGSCKMGRDDMAVVDPRLKVHGIDRLRVADASIMPVVASGNTNAAAMVVGANAARILLEDAR